MQPVPSQLYLWDKRTLYIGPLSEPIELTQGAATLTVALDSPILFKTKKMTHAIECESLLLPPGLQVSVNTQNAVVANCNLDPIQTDWYALKEQMEREIDHVYYNIKNISFYRDTFLKIHQEQCNSKVSYSLLMKLLENAASKQMQTHKVDIRIVEVIDRIKSNFESNLTIDSLAQSINLSVPRLVQLFKQQTGIPIRRYRLWHRLYITSIKMGEGYSLTDAAIAAGFTDGAHFTNTFRSMLGMKPSVILSQPNQIRINLPQ